MSFSITSVLRPRRTRTRQPFSPRNSASERTGDANVSVFRIDLWKSILAPRRGQAHRPVPPGLPAVQQISCEKQEPRMKYEHRHGLYVGCPRPRFKTSGQCCDLMARHSSTPVICVKILPDEIDEYTSGPYLPRYVGTCRSFPISLAEPPASPGGLGALAPPEPPGSPHNPEASARRKRRPRRSYEQHLRHPSARHPEPIWSEITAAHANVTSRG